MLGICFRSLTTGRLQKKALPGITKDISWGTKSGSSFLIAVGGRSNGPKIPVRVSNAVRAVTGPGECAVIWVFATKLRIHDRECPRPTTPQS